MAGLKGRDRTKSSLKTWSLGVFMSDSEQVQFTLKLSVDSLVQLSSLPKIYHLFPHCALFSQTVVLTGVMHWGREREREPK